MREWVVIHFLEGALAAGREGKILAQGSVRIAQEKIAGTTGAGDAFGAGLLLGLHEGKPMAQCLHHAVCVAAACLTDATTSAGILALAHCVKLGHSFGFRDLK